MIHRCFEGDLLTYNGVFCEWHVHRRSCSICEQTVVVVFFNTLWRRDDISRLEDVKLAIYASNKLTFVLTSPFFRGYKLRAFIRFTGACPPAISRVPANTNAIGERERRVLQCILRMSKNANSHSHRKRERERERNREKEKERENVYCSVISLRIDMKRFEMLVVPSFLSCALTDFAIDLMRL